MRLTKMSEEQRLFEERVERHVDLIFKRAYKIRKIRRRRKLNQWLNRHLN